MACIQVSFGPSERPRALSYFTAVSGLGSILGQVVGGFLLAANLFNMGWCSIFLINVPIGIVTLLAAFPLLRESRKPDINLHAKWQFSKREDRSRIKSARVRLVPLNRDRHKARELDSGGVVLLTLTLFLLVFPLVQGGNAGWPLWAQICLVLSVPCLIAFLNYEQRITKQGRVPLVSLALFRQRRFSSGILTVALAFSLFAAMLFLMAFYLQTILGLAPLEAGLAIMIQSIAYVLASSLNPVVASRLGKSNMIVAAALVTLGYLLTFIASQFLVPLWGIYPLLVALLIMGLAMGSLMTPLLHKTLEGVGLHDAGTASGVFMTAFQTSGALGVATIGLIDAALTSSSGNPQQAFILSTLVIMLLSLGLLLTVQPLSKPLTSPNRK